MSTNKYDSFLKQVDQKLSSESLVKCDLKHNPDYIMFMNTIKDRKYEFRKIAAKHKLCEQHQTIKNIVSNLYYNSDLKFTVDSTDDLIHYITSYVIGIDTEMGAFVKLYLIYCIISGVTLYFFVDDYVINIMATSLLSILYAVITLPIVSNTKFRLYRIGK